MEYEVLKHSHAGMAYLSVLLFSGRFFLFKAKPDFRSNKLLKILPHIIDTFLLVFAIMLVVQFSIGGSWLGAKVVGLLAYIGLGVVAIRRGNVAAFIGALVIFVYMVGVAKTHSAFSWFMLIS